MARADLPDQWISSSETIRLVRTHLVSFTRTKTIARGHMPACSVSRASVLMSSTKSEKDAAVPKEFWWAEGKEALTANWKAGDFETWIDRRLRIRAFGVRFHAGDLRDLIPNAVPLGIAAPDVPALAKGGRPPAEWWDDLWIEMCRALYVGDLQPQRQADIEKAMNDWIASKGESAAFSTVRSRARKLWQALSREDEN